MSGVSKLHEVGSGVMVRAEGHLLHIVVDMTRRDGASKSGKTTIVASTKGIIKAPGHPEVSYGFNAFVKPGSETEAA